MNNKFHELRVATVYDRHKESKKETINDRKAIFEMGGREKSVIK